MSQHEIKVHFFSDGDRAEYNIEIRGPQVDDLVTVFNAAPAFESSMTSIQKNVAILFICSKQDCDHATRDMYRTVNLGFDTDLITKIISTIAESRNWYTEST